MNTKVMLNEATTQADGARLKNKLFRSIRRILAGLIIILVALGFCGAIYQAIATATDQRTYPAPGQMEVVLGGGLAQSLASGTGQWSGALVVVVVVSATQVEQFRQQYQLGVGLGGMSNQDSDSLQPATAEVRS